MIQNYFAKSHYLCHMYKIAIFASGEGTNAEQIIRYFRGREISAHFLIICNNPHAGILLRAQQLHVPAEIFHKAQFDSGMVSARMKDFNPDLIVLAGFLLKIPEDMIRSFPDRILNIHPALLPKFGGKGMYGMHVHRAVIEKGETKTGITIHLVNEHYDEGRILFQQSVPVLSSDTAEDVSAKVRKLELIHYPETILSYLINTAK